MKQLSALKHHITNMSNFHASAQDIRLDDGHMLRARLTNMEGEEVDAEINLNDCIGNSEGKWTTPQLLFGRTTNSRHTSRLLRVGWSELLRERRGHYF